MSTASATTTTTDSRPRFQSAQSKFVQHLATYPALAALAGLIASFPLAKIFVSNAVPLLHALHERSRPIADPVAENAAPYLRTLDNAGDAVLAKLDERFPQLHTVQPADVYEDAQNYIGSVKGSAYAVYENRVVQPISSVASAARQQLEAINSVAAPKIHDTYTTKLSEQTAGTSDQPGYVAKLLAALATGKFLSIESYHIALSHFGSPEKLEEAVGIVKEKVVAAEKTAGNAVDEVQQAAEAHLAAEAQ